MKSTYATLIQSRFFTPAFNSALFDGPIRIYFSQFHESLALKIYFGLQQNFAEDMEKAKDYHRVLGRNILVMLYPSTESFSLSFEGQKGEYVIDQLEEDHLIGINGPFEDEMLPTILQSISKLVKSWEHEVAQIGIRQDLLA